MDKRKTKGTPDNIDVHVGQRLRVRRSLLGMSQEKLAEASATNKEEISVNINKITNMINEIKSKEENNQLKMIYNNF